MEKKILLKDIAESLGVSVALVSYVLNGKEREARVSPKTAKKIRKAALDMNYRPNLIAKSLKSGKSNAIGLIVADISNPFFSHLARTIEDESKKRGYTVIFGSSDENPEKSQRLIDALLNRSIDGFIIAPSEGSVSQLENLKKKEVPFVLIDRYFQEIETNYVIIDNFDATYRATKQLIEKGHKRIAFVRYNNHLLHTEKRYSGYVAAMKESHLKPEPDLICMVEFNDLHSFFTEFKKIINSENGVDALLFSTNTLSTLGLKALNILGKRVPEDIDVFCFDQNEAYDLFYHPIQYVHQPLDEIGKEAVRILADEMKTKSTGLQQIKLKTDLLVNNSLDFSFD